jgi:hypothetical protein
MNPSNAYYVLELPPEATPGEIERQGRKLLGLIEIGTARGTVYTCPLGTFTRDATMVREALAMLRDPKQRAKERCLAALVEAASRPAGDEAVDEDIDAAVPDALAIAYRGL